MLCYTLNNQHDMLFSHYLPSWSSFRFSTNQPFSFRQLFLIFILYHLLCWGKIVFGETQPTKGVYRPWDEFRFLIASENHCKSLVKPFLCRKAILLNREIVQYTETHQKGWGDRNPNNSCWDHAVHLLCMFSSRKLFRSSHPPSACASGVALRAAALIHRTQWLESDR